MRRKKSEYEEFVPLVTKKEFIEGIQRRAAARRAAVVNKDKDEDEDEGERLSD